MTILNRRRWIGTSIAASAMGAIHIGMSHATDEDLGYGQVVGDPEAARVGGNVLRNGGNAIAGAAAQFAKDSGSRRLYFDQDAPLVAGKTLRNPELADMLVTLANANSVDPFYRGEFAGLIAAQFQKNGGTSRSTPLLCSFRFALALMHAER